MSVPLIKIRRSFDVKTDLARAFLDMYCALHKIKLSEAERECLAYFCVYGVNIKLVTDSKILAKSSINNTLTKFRKHGFIYKVNKEDVLNKDFKLNSDLLGVVIRLEKH